MFPTFISFYHTFTNHSYFINRSVIFKLLALILLSQFGNLFNLKHSNFRREGGREGKSNALKLCVSLYREKKTGSEREGEKVQRNLGLGATSLVLNIISIQKWIHSDAYCQMA